jgi:predicted Zn-dependent protease
MRRVYVFTVLSLSVFAQDAKKDPEQIGTRDVSKGVNFFSIEREMALGKQLAQQLESHSTLVTDKVITEYVNRLGQNLARHSDAQIPLTIKVIEGDDANAVTLPGGYIYLRTGLLRIADTEAELAAAIAHEIAHVAARHGTRQATQTQLAQVASIPLFFLGGWGGVCAIGASNGSTPMLLMAAQRSNEEEADLLGLQYLYKSGYDPLGMVDIFEKLFSLDPRQSRMSKVFSTHPVFGMRLVSVQKNIETLLKQQPQYVVTTSEFNEVQARLLALDWDRKPEPVAPKAPTLHKPGDEIANSKKLVPETDARASQIKEAYTIR